MYVYSNLATSLDGKIATVSRELFPLGTPLDRKIMKQLRVKCDAVLMGAASLRAFKAPLVTDSAKGRQPLNVIVSRSLEGVSPKWKFFTSKRVRRLLFVTEALPESKLKAFGKSCEIVRLARPTRKNSIATQMLRALEARGIGKLVVEGGGALMWDFVSEDLIDEYYVTLTPRLLGGTQAPTLVDGPGLSPKAVVNLKLVQCRKVGDELFLRYRKTGRRGP